MAKKYNSGKNTCQAVCETAASMWNITYDVFESAGIEIKLANTFNMALVTQTSKKTDKVDAKKLATLLKLNELKTCYVPISEIRGVRDMVRHHVRLTQDRTKVINRVRSMLDKHDYEITEGSLYTKTALAELESIKLAPVHDEMIIHQCARQIRYLTDELAEIEQAVAEAAASNEYAQLLMSMTGVGTYIALLIAVEIADISRFKEPKNLVSWAGLCPDVYQSGNVMRMGRIKKLDTNRLVNWAMIQAANVAVRHDDRLALVFERSKKRHAGKHAPAIVVVANKMMTIAWHMLSTKTPYESRNEALYRRKLNKMRKKSRK